AAKSPNLNSFSERWVKSVREGCLSKLILFGESSLKRALQQYELHYHEERNHQGKENRLLFPRQTQPVGTDQGSIQCQERLGGLLKYYYRQAALGAEGGKRVKRQEFSFLCFFHWFWLVSS